MGAVEDLRCLDEDLDREASAAASTSAQTPQQQSPSSEASAMQSSASTPDSTPSTRDGSPGSVTLQMKQHYALANQRTPPTPDVRLYHRAVVVAQDTPGVCDACLRVMHDGHRAVMHQAFSAGKQVAGYSWLSAACSGLNITTCHVHSCALQCC